MSESESPVVPRPRPNPRIREAVLAKPKRPSWGWIEGFILSQSLLPGLLFVPGISPVRPVIRIASYFIGVVAWVMVYLRGKASTADAGTFPARPWLLFSAAWLLLSLAHPNIYSIPAAVGQAMLYLSVLSPAFWAGESLNAPKQLNRIMALLFLCNALSASLGMAQVFSDRFNPPVIPAEQGVYKGDSLKIEVDGRRIFRPCGLTDSPGGASSAGAVAALLGLSFALRPIGLFRRAACAGLAFIGVAVIYYTQVRSILLVLAFSLIVLTVFFVLQRRLASALTLAGGGSAMIVGSLFWVTRRLGASTFERFGGLASFDLADIMYRNRGGFVWQAMTETIWDNPLGYGLGWWGMVHVLFFEPTRLSMVWVEVMISAWIIDGGIPLLIGYGGAVLIAAYCSARIALTSRDPEVSFWAAVVLAQNVSSVTLCFSYVTFLSPIGLQFWLLNAAIYAADAQSRGAAAKPATTARSARLRRALRPWPPGRAST